MSRVVEVELDDLRPEYDFNQLREVHPPGHYAARYHTPAPPAVSFETTTVDRILLLLLLGVLGVWAAWVVWAFRRRPLADYGGSGLERNAPET